MSKHLLVFAVLFQVFAFAGTARAQRVPTPASVRPGAGVPVRGSIVFDGFVLDPDGAPAEGAVVVTSAGGRAVTDVRGHYRLDVEVPRGAESVEVSAVGAGEADLAASTSVQLLATTRFARVELLRLVQRVTGHPRWLPTFGCAPGTDGDVSALAVFDDGGGPALYAGGIFSQAGGPTANRIGKWDRSEEGRGGKEWR